MNKFFKFYKTFPTITTLFLVVLITSISQLQQYEFIERVNSPLLIFGMNTFFGALTCILVGVGWILLAQLYEVINSELEEFALQYNFNIFGLMRSKQFIDLKGNKIWCTRGSYYPTANLQFQVVIHRFDGPAYEGKNGSKVWYLNDVKLSIHEFLKQTPASDKIKEKIRVEYAEYLV